MRRRILHLIDVTGVLLVPACLAAQRDKNHYDAFVAGLASESRLAQQVRHQLLMLPYYTV